MPVKRKSLARHFRQNMSKPEVLLWVHIKNDQTGYRIKRQYSFGSYILDFYCPSLKVGIEVDGQDHLFRKRYDERRDEWLASEGVRIYRIPAATILDSPSFAAQQLKNFLDVLNTESS